MRLAGILSLGAMLGSGLLASDLRKQVQAPEGYAGLESHETHASASLLGQFRTSVSAWLWLRTDLYLHNGVELRRMTASEQRRGRREEAPAQGEELHDESGVVTVIPPKEHDFRGVFGDLERSVSAFQQMSGHSHNDPQSALPLFRLMTWLDPQFIPGWVVGASAIARDRSPAGTRAAMDYLREGLQANPRHLGMWAELARLAISRQSDLQQAVRWLEQARRVGKDQVRWLTLCYRDLGQKEKMQEVLREGLERFPSDGVLQRLNEPHRPPVAKAREN